jgi:uncharacterized membrane protein YfcA
MWTKLGGRKFLAFAVVMSLASVGLYLDKLDGQVWQYVTMFVTATYAGSNLGERIVDKLGGPKPAGEKKA